MTLPNLQLLEPPEEKRDIILPEEPWNSVICVRDGCGNVVSLAGRFAEAAEKRKVKKINLEGQHPSPEHE